MTNRRQRFAKNKTINPLTGQNYLQMILDNPPLKGTVVIAHIYHDDWCGIWTTGKCNCKPDIVYEYPNLRGKKNETSKIES